MAGKEPPLIAVLAAVIIAAAWAAILALAGVAAMYALGWATSTVLTVAGLAWLPVAIKLATLAAADIKGDSDGR